MLRVFSKGGKWLGSQMTLNWKTFSAKDQQLFDEGSSKTPNAPRAIDFFYLK